MPPTAMQSKHRYLSRSPRWRFCSAWRGSFCNVGGSIRAFRLVSRLSFCLFDKKKRLAMCCVSIPRIAPPELSVLGTCYGHLTMMVHLSAYAFCSGGTGDGGWRRRAFCLLHISLALLCFPRGVRWGCAPQTRAKEPLALWTLLSCGGLGYHKLKTSQKAARQNSRCHASNTRVLCGHLLALVHLSFLRFLFRWRGKRGWRRNAFTYCISLWLCYAFRGEYVGAARPKTAPKSHWLSGLSSAAAGWAATDLKPFSKPHGRTVLIRRQNPGTLETCPAPIYGWASRVAAQTS